MTFLVLFLLLVFAGIGWLEAPPLIRRRQWQELAAFSILLALGLALSLTLALAIKVPNPTRGIEFLIKQGTNIFGL